MASMGLAERRQIHYIETESIPQAKRDAEDFLGFPVEWKLDAESLAELTLDHLAWVESDAVIRIKDVLKQIGRDPLGKEAIWGAIQQVVIRHVPNSDDAKATAGNGVLTFSVNFRNVYEGAVDFQTVVKTVEAAL